MSWLVTFQDPLTEPYVLPLKSNLNSSTFSKALGPILSLELNFWPAPAPIIRASQFFAAFPSAFPPSDF